MMREYFDLERQIVHLVMDKSVMFEHSDFDIAKRLLRDNNYRNLVSCSKIKFAELIGNSMRMYRSADFKEWIEYFEMDRKVSKHLMSNLIDLELTINSRVSHYVSELLESSRLSNFERNAIIQIVSQIRDRKETKFSIYNGKATWDYVPKMTFGEMKQLVFWLHGNKQETFFKLIDGYSFLRRNARSRFNELNHLRNNLFHLTPLTIHLIHAKISKKGLKNMERRKVVRWISNINSYQEVRNDFDEICFHSDKYIAIKNSLRNVD